MPAKKIPVEDRFFSKILFTDSCWLWVAAKDKDGYGMLQIEGRAVRSHRVSFKLFYGELPPELNVCHSCDNPSCVSPDHLWLGTVLANNQDRDKKGRNGNANKTHCKIGHEYTEDNTFMHNGSRECVKCVNIRQDRRNKLRRDSRRRHKDG